METDGTRQRGDWVKDDKKSFGLSCENAHNKDDWILRIKMPLVTQVNLEDSR